MEEHLQAKTTEIEAYVEIWVATQIPHMFEAWTHSKNIMALPSDQFLSFSSNDNDSVVVDWLNLLYMWYSWLIF